jgi:hypothetical protein
MIKDIQGKFSDLIIELHDLAREIKDSGLSIKVRYVANDLAKIGNEHYENEQKAIKK